MRRIDIKVQSRNESEPGYDWHDAPQFGITVNNVDRDKALTILKRHLKYAFAATFAELEHDAKFFDD